MFGHWLDISFIHIRLSMVIILKAPGWVVTCFGFFWARNWTAISTHWGQNQIDYIVQMPFFKSIFLDDKFEIFNKMSMGLVPQFIINSNSSFVQLMTWYARQQAITWINVDPDLWFNTVSQMSNASYYVFKTSRDNKQALSTSKLFALIAYCQFSVNITM